MRLTSEREREIREFLGDATGMVGGNVAMELLAEIDALRSDLKESQEDVKYHWEQRELGGQIEAALKEERERLREALEKISKITMADDWGETTRWCRRVAKEALGIDGQSTQAALPCYVDAHGTHHRYPSGGGKCGCGETYLANSAKE